MTLKQAEQLCRQAKGYRAASFRYCYRHGLGGSCVGHLFKARPVELTNEWGVDLWGRVEIEWIMIVFPNPRLKYMYEEWRGNLTRTATTLEQKGVSHDND